MRMRGYRRRDLRHQRQSNVERRTEGGERAVRLCASQRDDREQAASHAPGSSTSGSVLPSIRTMPAVRGSACALAPSFLTISTPAITASANEVYGPLLPAPRTLLVFGTPMPASRRRPAVEATSRRAAVGVALARSTRSPSAFSLAQGRHGLRDCRSGRGAAGRDERRDVGERRRGQSLRRQSSGALGANLSLSSRLAARVADRQIATRGLGRARARITTLEKAECKA